jgi:hypothetical protein
VEAADVADLGDEHRPEQRPDTGDLLDRPVAGIRAQPPGDQPGEGVDLEVQRGDQPHQRVDPATGLHRQHRARQHRADEQLLATRTEQVAHRHRHAGGGEHGMDLALEVRP